MPPADVSNSELKSLLEAQAARDDRRREADIEWRVRFEGVLKTLADEVAHVRKRQDHSEERQARVERELAIATGRTEDAMSSTVQSETRLVGSINNFVAQVNTRLDSQDREIAHVRRATDSQMPMLAALTTYMDGAQANTGMLKWLVPLTGGAIVAIIPALWWLFTVITTHH